MFGANFLLSGFAYISFFLEILKYYLVTESLVVIRCHRYEPFRNPAIFLVNIHSLLKVKQSRVQFPFEHIQCVEKKKTGIRNTYITSSYCIRCTSTSYMSC